MKLIEDWKRAWKLYSVWAFALILAAPDLYDAAVRFGLFDADDTPGPLKFAIRALALAGFVVRLIQQKRPAPLPEPQADAVRKP